MTNELAGLSPAPWHSDKNTPGDHIRILGSDGRSVCSIFCAGGNQIGRERQIANARLIVGAPALLGELAEVCRDPSPERLRRAGQLIDAILGIDRGSK